MPEIARPAMSKTEAIVTMMCIDKDGEDIKVCTSVLTPASEKTANYEVYSGKGKTVGEAVENISLALGKSIGFAQCEIMGFGDNLSEEGIMSTLDFMTRTRRVGRNALLINFSGEVEKFAQAVVNMNIEKSLHLEDIMNFDQRYILSEDSNIHSFYKGYFSKISLGIMPKIKLETEDKGNSIEVQESATGGGSSNEPGSGSGGDSKKEYILNDGTACIFRNGEKILEITPDTMKKLNLFINESQEGTLTIDHVTDDLYDDASIILHVSKKDVSFTPKFDGEKPIYEISIDVTVLVEEVDEENPSLKFLKRNKEFLTPTLIEKTKQQVEKQAYEIIEYCKENKVDLIHVYEFFYRKQYKKFSEYYDKMQEKYLDNIDYKISVKVNSSY